VTVQLSAFDTIVIREYPPVILEKNMVHIDMMN
jgi:hypothetical protein